MIRINPSIIRHMCEHEYEFVTIEETQTPASQASPDIVQALRDRISGEVNRLFVYGLQATKPATNTKTANQSISAGFTAAAASTETYCPTKTGCAICQDAKKLAQQLQREHELQRCPVACGGPSGECLHQPFEPACKSDPALISTSKTGRRCAFCGGEITPAGDRPSCCLWSKTFTYQRRRNTGT